MSATSTSSLRTVSYNALSQRSLKSHKGYLSRQLPTQKSKLHVARIKSRCLAASASDTPESDEEARKARRDARRAQQMSAGGAPGGNVASRVKMVAVETRESVAGIASVDKGEISEDERLRRAVLLGAGDFACLVLFCAIGRANHAEDVFTPATLLTALPFVIGWFSAGKKLSEYNLGAFTAEATSTKVGAAAIGAAQNWLLGIPTGCLLRSLFQLRIAPMAFTGIAMAVTGVLLLGWRVAAASLIEPQEGSGGGGSRKGGPLEFLSVITRLSTRW